MIVYDRKYSYEELKAICETFGYLQNTAFDYEDIILIAMNYYKEWLEKYADLDLNEKAYEQSYFARRVREDYKNV